MRAEAQVVAEVLERGRTLGQRVMRSTTMSRCVKPLETGR